MNKKRLIFLPAIVGVFMFSNCKEGVNKQDNNGADSLYSGAKFNEHIRSTEARTPEEERQGFKLPEGFEINLFASEPDIGKPINLTFDEKGRVWVTQSFEYPFAARPGTGKDRVTILEDTDGDGKADKFTHFNDTLNIPIGVLPLNDGAMVYSIPNVYKFRDANGDGKADSVKKILGPFETKDTHGMVNNFTWGYDGWIHACHGFSNRSTVAGADGDSVHLISGNTIRFRPDGSRVEHVTYGRINPFGLTYDELGYQYSTDCHTSPLYQLIRGGDYTQWGKEEGMGFAPDMKSFDDEATALAGITYYADNLFPEAYRSNFYIGDAVSSRVYRNSYTWKESSPVGKKEGEFVLSADPWFRPVDVKMGPDGAIYIADFYNSIIGHYEVPLDHPKRDRIRGRIWRITYKGKANKNTDWSKADIPALIAAFKSPNLPVRLTAANQLADRIGATTLPQLNTLISKKGVSTNEYVHALWVIQRLNALKDDLIVSSAQHADPVIRVHAMRVIAEQKDTSSALYPVISKALEDKDPHVRRAAVEVMSRYVNMNSVDRLISFRKGVPDADSHMIYTVRLILRNLLRHESLMKDAAARNWSADDAAVLSTVMVGVESPASGVFLFNYVKNHDLSSEELPKAFRHIVRFVPEAQVNEVISTGMKKGDKNNQTAYQVFRALKEGLARRGKKETGEMAVWGRRIVTNVMNRNLKATDAAPAEVADELNFAVEAAGEYKLAAVEDRLASVFSDTAIRRYIRSNALRSLMKINPEKNARLAQTVLDDPNTNPEFKRDIVYVLGEFPGEAVNKMLAGIKNASPDLQQGIVLALAGSSSGKNILFEKVRKGEIFARTLAEPKVEERLMLNISGEQEKIYKALTANLEKIDSEKQSLISGRIADYNNLKQKPAPETGRQVFVKNCSPCHSIKGDGGAIGPQLDGVGKWGVAPLVEKILDPNRNISENFRSYTLKLRDGKVLSGLYRRDEGQVIVFANAAGQEFAVSKQDVVERKASKYSLMPDQFRNTIPVDEFNSLISYLLSQK